MKKIISLFAVALMATTFAAGCGKLKECKEATDKATCIDKTKFDPEKTCTWDDKTDPNKPVCKQ